MNDILDEVVDKRRARRSLLKDRQKKLIALFRKKLKLAEAKRQYNWVELPKPERYGYRKFFVIRPDIAKGFPNKVPMFQDILKLCGTEVHSRDKKFLRRDWKTKKMMPIEHTLKYIMPREWEKLPSDKHREMFQPTYRHDYRSRMFLAYELVDPWMFIAQVKPRYITHRLVLDPQLDRELKEIENKIERNNLWPDLAKAFGWQHNWHEDGISNREKGYIEALNLDVKEYLIDGR